MTETDIAQRFHEAYERLAPEFGYKTREASAVPWEDVPENNKALMIATVREVLADDPVAETAARLVETGARYENALLWIRHLATLHYLGDAFDPEHMRTLANIAANVLTEDARFRTDDLPDFEQARDEARAEAERLSELFAIAIDNTEVPDG
jgi:hypothetical protein